MGRAKTRDKARADELWEQYQAMQLTPEQKKAARAETEARAEQARIDGVYERVREIAGTVKWSMTWRELRGK